MAGVGTILVSLRSNVRSFVSDTQGTVTIESLISLPLLMFWYIASFTFFDAYRVINMNEKAAYTLADMVSRIGGGQSANQPYLNGMNQLFDYMVKNQGASWIRVTSIRIDTDTNPDSNVTTDDYYQILWSHSTNSATTHAAGIIAAGNAMIPRLPSKLRNDDTIIVVETSLEYTPPFNIGLPKSQFRTFIFTSPRYLPDAPGIPWTT